MKDIYKYGFWLLLVSLITLCNYFITENKLNNNEMQRQEDFYEKRINSLIFTAFNKEEKVSLFHGNEVISGKIYSDILKEKIMVILLEDFKCNKCQENELKKLELNYRKFKEKGIDVVGLTIKSKRIEIARFIKRLKLHFPIFYISEDLFYNKLSLERKYPQIIYIENKNIILRIMPIINDLSFTDLFYKKILSN